MSVLPLMLDLRARLDAMPLDRAPLRRAGLLTVLLVVLLVVGKAFGPGRAASLPAAPDRHKLQAPTEEVSAPRRTSGWTGGRILAVLLLAAGGGVAYVLHRRRAPAGPGTAAALDLIETRTLGPGQSLQLVACGEEVLLLSVGGDGAQLLRHWPRERFDRGAVSFADALADATDRAEPSGDDATEPSDLDDALPEANRPEAARPHENVPTPRPATSAVVEASPAVPVAAQPAPTEVPAGARGALFPLSSRPQALPQFGTADA